MYRWDLDKTYLRTEFDTVKQLVKTAFEGSSHKQAVPGATALLREIQATHPHGIHILSGSPEPMRRILEKKLEEDGVRWDSFVLKPSVQNLLRGRIRFLRDQIRYKLGTLLAASLESDSAEQPPGEILFGDDAEADAFIYSLYADLRAGRVSRDQLAQVLRDARLYEDDYEHLMSLASNVKPHDVVERVFVHLARVSSPNAFDVFGKRVVPFFNYFQPAVMLAQGGKIGFPAAIRVGRSLVRDGGFGAEALAASMDDLARRELLAATDVEQVQDAAAAVLAGLDSRVEIAACEALLRRCDSLQGRLGHGGAHGWRFGSPGAVTIDYAAVFTEDRKRAHTAKRRALWKFKER